MKRIGLTKGKIALVDDDDFEYLNRWRWSAFNSRRRPDSYYARRTARVLGKKKVIKMHHAIIPLVPGMMTDHIDGNGLNNQRSNLRMSTKQQNQANSRKRKGCSSQYKGVSWSKRDKRWCSQVKVNGKLIYLGYFHDEESAARVYDAAALKYFGEFARLNFPKDQFANDPSGIADRQDGEAPINGVERAEASGLNAAGA